jgi:type III secretion protein U
MSDQSEEKKHPPSGKRLRELRDREGQVARSKDFPAAVSLTAAIGYLIANFGNIWQQLGAFFDIFEEVFAGNLYESPLLVAAAGGRLALTLAVPVALVAAAAFFVTSLLHTNGLVISTKSLAPDFSRINPTSSIGRIFGFHGLSDSIKLMIKIILLTIATNIILRWGLNSLFWSPTCEEGCVMQATVNIVIAVIIAALIIYLLIGIIDLWISKILFKHDNRMTDTDKKREEKEEYGAKEVRQHRSELKRELARNPPVRGFGKATLLIRDGLGVVGLAYVPGRFDVPVVVGKAYGDESRKALEEAHGKRIPILEEKEFLSDLMQYTRVGEPVPQSMIHQTARIFLRHGIVKRS